MYVVQTSSDRVNMACDIYCCMLSQCEVSRSCCLGPLITTVVNVDVFARNTAYFVALWFQSCRKRSHRSWNCRKFIQM